MSSDEKLAREWLERIESYHRRVEGDDDCGNCGQAFPCDVVKLARALKEALKAMNAVGTVVGRDAFKAAWQRMEEAYPKGLRTLREVAGGSDD